MTEEKQDEATKDEGKLEFPEGLDPTLKLLITMANTGARLNASVTVIVNGVRVTGSVFGAREAHKWFTETFLESLKTKTRADPSLDMPPEQEAGLVGMLRSLVEEEGPRLLEKIDKHPLPKRIDFLCLKNARVWDRGSSEPIHLEMFRIRLAQVDAFSLGEPSED